MKKIIILAASLLMLTVLVSSLFSVSAAEAKYDAQKIRQQYLEGAYSTDREKLISMTKMMSHNGYTIYVEEQTGEVAIVKDKTGQILWTNPYDVTSQEVTDIQKGNLLSQIILNYTTISTGASATMNSFEEAAMRINAETGANQITVKNISGGVRVEYTMGRTETRVLVPRMISKDRFDECILNPLKEAAKQNLTTTDGTSARFLLSKFYNEESGKTVFYSLKDPNGKGVTERQKRAMFLQYPITEKMPVYVIDSGATQVELVNWLEKAITNFTSYTFEDMANDHNLTNYTGNDVAPPLFRIALEYYLDEDGVTVRCPANGIRFDSTLYRLDNITVLPYLGAGKATDGGYNFIPDGSGSIIEFQDVAGTAVSLSGKIYGQDYAYYNLSGANQEIMRLPVYGTIVDKINITSVSTRVPVLDEEGNPVLDENGQPVTEIVKQNVKEVSSSGYIAIIEEGEAIGSIYTNHGGNVHPYNSTYAVYVPRPNDSYALTQFSESSSSMWNIVTDRRYTGNITMKLIMLKGSEANYSGMANAYRNYLTARGEISRNETEEKVPLFIESFGAIEVTDRVLGVPVDVKKPMTTYKDLEAMVNELQAGGVGNISIKYQSWANDAFETKPFTKLTLEKVTGGKSGLQGFIEFAKDKGVQIYPDVELTYVYWLDLFDGFDYNKMVSRKVDKRMAFKLAYDDEYQGFMRWEGDVISPQFMSKIWDKIDTKYTDLGVGGVSLGLLGSDLNSNHSKKYPLNRVEAQEYVEDVFALIEEQAGKILVDGGNAYSVKYADAIVNAPLESSRYIYASQEVPFYGMVFHGSVEFSGEAINAAADYYRAVLKTIENGAVPFFRVSYQNTNELKTDINTSKYFSVDYNIWKDDVIATYNEINEALSDLQDKYIVKHDAIGEKSVCVVYEDGTEMFINYDRNNVFVYKNSEGDYKVSYAQDVENGITTVQEEDKDPAGKVTIKTVTYEVLFELDGLSWMKRGDN